MTCKNYDIQISVSIINFSVTKPSSIIYYYLWLLSHYDKSWIDTTETIVTAGPSQKKIATSSTDVE